MELSDVSVPPAGWPDLIGYGRRDATIPTGDAAPYRAPACGPAPLRRSAHTSAGGRASPTAVHLGPRLAERRRVREATRTGPLRLPLGIIPECPFGHDECLFIRAWLAHNSADETGPGPLVPAAGPPRRVLVARRRPRRTALRAPLRAGRDVRHRRATHGRRSGLARPAGAGGQSRRGVAREVDGPASGRGRGGSGGPARARRCGAGSPGRRGGQERDPVLHVAAVALHAGDHRRAALGARPGPRRRRRCGARPGRRDVAADKGGERSGARRRRQGGTPDAAPHLPPRARRARARARPSARRSRAA